MAFKNMMWNMSVCLFVAFLLGNICVNGKTFTTFNDFDSAGDYSIDGLYCATYDSNQTLEWRSAYLWTGYCDKAGQPMQPSLCGSCLQVTNDATRQNVTVRVLDRCQNGGLVLETDAFNAIDGDGNGARDGHMLTTYKFVGC